MTCNKWEFISSWFEKGLTALLNLVCNMWNIITSTIENSDNLPSLIQGTGLALLTVLIPLALAIITDVYDKRNDGGIGFAALDLHVVLDNVFKIRNLLIYVSMIFIPMIFLEKSPKIIRYIEFAVSLIGICATFGIIFKVYNWIKGNSFLKYRISYLDKIRETRDIVVGWQSVWQAKITDDREEMSYFKKFSSFIDHQFEKNNRESLQIVDLLLNIFLNFIDKRSLYHLAQPDNYFEKTLEWHFKVWQKTVIDFESKVKQVMSTEYSITLTLVSIIEKIEVRVIKESQSSYFMFFIGYIKKYFDNMNDHRCKEKKLNESYIEELLSKFCPLFFGNIASSSAEKHVWRSFPSEWKITKDNLENKDILPTARIFWDKFQLWAAGRILSQKDEIDKELENVSLNLFPEVDPSLWANILLFSFLPFGENISKSVIEQPLNFGLMGRSQIHSIWEGDDKEEIYKQRDNELKDQRTKTIELACLVFSYHFSIEKLEKYIKELENLESEYKNESQKECRRVTILGLFKEMLDYVKKQKTE